MRLSAVVKGLGAATVAGAGRGNPWTRAVVAGTTYRLGKQIDPAGLDVVSVTVREDVPSSPSERVLAEVVGIGSWTAASMLAASVLDRLPLPRPVVALGCGSAVYLADDQLNRKLQEMKARAEARAAQPAQ